MEINVVDSQGNIVETTTLNEAVFDAEVKSHLLHEVVTMQLANRRQGTASTKTRGEVRGGGAKPWRQKGTGRARAGSRRSPLWRGGGTIFGPKPRDYSYTVPKKVRRAALRSALSAKVREAGFTVMDQITLPQPKTREMVALLKRLDLAEKKVLIVLDDMTSEVVRAARNLPQVKVLPVIGINVYDLLYHDAVLCTKAVLEKIEERAAL